MLTQEQIAAIEAEIGNAASVATTVAGVLDPQLIPFIILGRAVAAGAPVLITDVQRLLAKSEPTAADNAALAKAIAALGQPETL